MKTASIKILETVKPPLRWIPECREFTTEFLQSRAKGPDGPSFSELTEGPDSVLQEAQRILGRCLPPDESGACETGLVVGYVQSGKTLSFETVIALARDNGYGMVIVIAGVTNELKDQSEGRLRKDLGIDAGEDHWIHFPNPTPAVQEQIKKKIGAWRKKHAKKSVLVTVLKNGTHLRNLAGVLSAIDLRDVPVLVVDDESDQASLNTKAAKIRTGAANADEKSPTYEKILNLRKALPHHSYLQYTATPQANLLLAQADLLNASFAELVTPGPSYAGGKAFFKENLGVIADIPARDVPSATNLLKSPPKTLLKALRYFLLVSAQHSVTRIQGAGGKDRNRSMMVHPAVPTNSHKQYKTWVENAIASLTSLVGAQYKVNPKVVARLFAEEYDSLSRTYPSIKPLHTLVEAMVDDVFDELRVVLVNGTKDAEKKIDWKATRYWVLVGGFKLDRGYTVEGLCITYMPRPLGTSPAADTLQQRARFFGYKRSYLGLCRVFMQPTVCQAFDEYIEHEESVRTALAGTRGQPLKDWRRDFILTNSLHPTRGSVVGLGTRRIPVDGWLVPKVMQRDQAAAEQNRELLEKIDLRWRKKFGPVENVATILRFKGPKGVSPHDVIEGIPLRTVLEEFLLEVHVKDPEDAEEHAAMLIAISALLAKDNSLCADVFLMNKLQSGYRKRDAGRGVAASHPFAPINQVFSNSAGSINDRSLFSPERVSIHLRRFNLGTIERDPSSADIKDVVWFALNVPQKLRKDLLIEQRA